MRNHRFKHQTNTFGMFVGVTASAARVSVPPAMGDQISERIWLAPSQVHEGFKGTPLILTEEEIEWLRSGLRRVSADIERAERDGHVVVSVQALEIVEADYVTAALAPAIAGWAAEEFGFAPHRVEVTFDEPTKRYVFEWDR
ncbi:hypothetical protein [Amycolatopsis magusensis]|uniref:hypothetical protein n=1 Tax=Amycolatopsis magusensis TaxID=882444 RepID=UPI0037A7204F